jgi:metallophosphoesterase superfamily enzyme
VVLGRWRVVHGDGPLPAGPVVQGHEHPSIAWRNGPGGPCFLLAPDRLILPAYSLDAAGVNVLGVRHWRDFRCWVIAGREVLDLGPVSTLPRQYQDAAKSASRPRPDRGRDAGPTGPPCRPPSGEAKGRSQ